MNIDINSWTNLVFCVVFLVAPIYDWVPLPISQSNPRPLRQKHLPNQLSHRGVVIELNLKLGATHISLARFLVAPIYDWVPLFQKNNVELNPRCLHKLALQCHLCYSEPSIWFIILLNRCSKLASKCEKITQKWPERAKGCTPTIF